MASTYHLISFHLLRSFSIFIFLDQVYVHLVFLVVVIVFVIANLYVYTSLALIDIVNVENNG